MLTGATPAAVVALLEGLNVDAIGMNCGLGPEQMKPILKKWQNTLLYRLLSILMPDFHDLKWQDGL